MNCYFAGHEKALEQSYAKIASDMAWVITEFAAGINGRIQITRNRDNAHYNSVIDSLENTDWLIHPVAQTTYLYLSYNSYVIMIEFFSDKFKVWHTDHKIDRIGNVVKEFMDAGNGTFYTDRPDG